MYIIYIMIIECGTVDYTSRTKSTVDPGQHNNSYKKLVFYSVELVNFFEVKVNLTTRQPTRHAVR